MTVKLPAELTLSRVSQIRTTLLEALRGHESLEIDDQEVTEVDVAGLQLLCSLHRGTVLRGKKVTFLGGQRGEAIRQAYGKAGFLRHVGCAPGCLWETKDHG